MYFTHNKKIFSSVSPENLVKLASIVIAVFVLGQTKAQSQSNNLMDPENKRWVIADDVLKELLGVERFQGFTVSKYLSDHLLPMQ